MNPHQPSADPDRTALREPPVDSATVDNSVDSTRPKLPPPPTDAPVIPGYAVTGVIAKGGMGVVYAGYDLTLDREVAIKTLLPGANGDRFVTESKITARLPHPNIPPVYTLGTLADGTPFLTMKLIRGQTLSVLLKARPIPQHDLPRFVQIFEQIAQAVGFAHSRDVIHRDLKPLNVMVGEFGEVQVMDWGLARLASGGREAAVFGEQGADAPRSPDAALTQAGAIMGTPGYMAPEQARGEVVDARADVFALGAVLAAILTGKPAFVGTTVNETIQKAAAGDLTDVLVRLESCGADADLIALAKRCLSADRDTRPSSGRAVAVEVGAYRASVEARLRKAETERAEGIVREDEQHKRRRVLAWSRAVVVVVLLVGTAVSVWQAVVATNAREATSTQLEKTIAAEAATSAQLMKTQEAEAATTAQLKLTEAARSDAVEKLGFSKRSNQILGSLFKGLDPKARYTTVAELRTALKNSLRQAVRELEGTAIGDPVEVANLQSTLGMSLLNLGDPILAAELFQKVRDTREKHLGLDHHDTLAAMSNLANAHDDAGQPDKAITLLQETLKRSQAKRGLDHQDTIQILNNLSTTLLHAGHVPEAVHMLEEGLILCRAKLGPEHSSTLTCMNNLATSYQKAGNLSKAMPLLEEGLPLFREKFGPDHVDTMTAVNNLGMGFAAFGKWDQALPLLEEALKVRQAKLGADHLETLLSQNNLGTAYKAAGKPELAVPLLEEAVKLLKAKVGPKHSYTFNAMGNLGEAYCRSGQGDKASALLREFVTIMRGQYPKGSLPLAHVLAESATDLLLCDQFATAEEMLQEALAIREKGQPEAWNTFNTRAQLGAALLGQKKYKDAEPLLVAGYEGMKEREKDIPVAERAERMRQALDRLVELYTATDKPDEVKKYKEVREKYPAAKEEKK